MTFGELDAIATGTNFSLNRVAVGRERLSSPPQWLRNGLDDDSTLSS